jgi:hypothetical protein
MRFKKLNKKETEEYKQWARDTYVVGNKISSVWHPVVVAECKHILNHLCYTRLNSLLKKTSWSESDQGDIRWCLHNVLTSAGYLEQEDM